MPTPRIPIRYKRNPSRGFSGENGRKTTDERSGFSTYENLCDRDPFDVKCDLRRSTFDYRDDADGDG